MIKFAPMAFAFAAGVFVAASYQPTESAEPRLTAALTECHAELASASGRVRITLSGDKQE